jgi:hypothetical protein
VPLPMQCEARARQSRQPYTARPGRITRCARATAATEILAQPRPNSATAPPPPYSRQASTTPWGAVGGRPNSKAPNRRVSIENQQSNRARGGAPITTLCLDFYGHVGIMPNSSDTLNKLGFSLSLLQNFGERLDFGFHVSQAALQRRALLAAQRASPQRRWRANTLYTVQCAPAPAGAARAPWRPPCDREKRELRGRELVRAAGRGKVG